MTDESPLETESSAEASAFDRMSNRQLTWGAIASLPSVVGFLLLRFGAFEPVAWALLGLGVVATAAVALRALSWFRSSPRHGKLALLSVWQLAIPVAALVISLLFSRA